MSKLDIINEVATKAGITKTKAGMAVETVFESMKRALGEGERIELRGFSILRTAPKSAKRTLPPLPKLPYKSNFDQKELRRVIAEVAQETAGRAKHSH